MTRLRVQVIGLGVVGTAQAYLMSRLGHEVLGHDIDPGAYEKAREVISNLIQADELERDVDVTFICTPESEVERAVQQLIENKVKGIYVIRSTVPVGTTVRLMRKYNVPLSHNPEFLREKYALYDVMNPSRIVIGECCKEHGDLIEQLYRPLNRPIYRTDPTTSEIIKLTSNALRALMISFWNSIYLLSQRTGADIKLVAEASDPAKVIGEWEGGRWGTKFFGKPYGGKCLPKDTRHLINAMKEHGVDPAILEATEKINELFKQMEGESKEGRRGCA